MTKILGDLAVALTRRDGAGSVLFAILRNQGLALGEISADSQMQLENVERDLYVLLDLGYVEEVFDEGVAKYFLSAVESD